MVQTHPFSLPAYDLRSNGPPSKFYFICSTPRCGSYFLARELWRSGCLGAPHEYFNFHTVMFQMARRLEVDTLRDYIGALFRLRSSTNGVFADKTHYDQFQFLYLAGQLGDFQPMSLVHLRRDDTANQAVSLAIAQLTTTALIVLVTVTTPALL